jgi:hypothetical protein
LFQAALAAQTAGIPRAFSRPPEPPVPLSPMELVTGNAKPVQDLNQRAEIFKLLIQAIRRSNVRAQPYDLKSTFTVSGPSPLAGVWHEEDLSPSAGLYRWTVQGPGYSAVNLNKGQVFFSSRPDNSLPLRLIQFREAIFYNQPIAGPQSSLRTASATFNGVNLNCVLIGGYSPSLNQADGRHWDEEEFCIDPVKAIVIAHSPAPGLYVLYDYSKALQFHGHLIPNQFTIMQAGQPVIEAHTESVTDPSGDLTPFEANGLNPLGVGPAMTGPWRFRMTGPLPPGAPAGTTQIVVLHGLQQAGGGLSDPEVLSSSDSSLNDSALAFASGRMRGQMQNQGVAGATPQSHEALITVEYAAPQ